MSMTQQSDKKPGNRQLREERLRQHWSQQELADRLGTTVTSIKRWERGATTPSPYFRVKLMALFGKSVQELGLYEEEPSQKQAQEAQAPEVDDASSLPTSGISDDTSSSDDPTLSRETFPSSPTASVPIEVEVSSSPPSISPPLREKNQARMIELVETIWIRGMLEQSLHGAALQALGLYEQPDAVANPWRLMLQELERPMQLLPPGTSICQVYDATNGLLLILGDPGAGKTTLLLDLARTLLARARQDPQHPIPVVFNLSSWAIKQLPLEAWLIQELQEKYQVPRTLSKQWVETDMIIPLLDGLDEVAIEQRTACIEILNSYRQDHGLMPMVVCSRHADYQAQRGRLLLRSAVLLQPLTTEQIQDYLASFGEQVEGLRLALHEDAELQSLATTPLMLNILTLTYHGFSRSEVLTTQTLQNRRHQIFECYVERMLRRRGTPLHATSQQIIARLAWLARQLTARQETEFHLEHLQFDWLSPGWISRSMPGFSMGCLQGLLIGLIFTVLMGLYHSLRSGLITGLAVGACNVVLCGLLNGVVEVWANKPGDDIPKKSPLRSCFNTLLNNRMLYGLLFAILNSFYIGLLFSLQNDLHFSLKYGLHIPLLEPILYGLLYGFLIGCAFSAMGRIPQMIHPAETTNWSWQTFRHNAGKYGAIGIAIGLIHGIIYPFEVRAILVVATGLSALLVAGISNNVLERHQRIRPNQGIWRSARNGWQAGLIAGTYTWLLVAGLFGYFYGPLTGLLYGIVPGLSVGFCLALQQGGTAFFLHLILRSMLWWEGTLPWNVSRFLDEAADRVLLRKVGGGYIFVHRYLLEYFASLGEYASKEDLLSSLEAYSSPAKKT